MKRQTSQNERSTAYHEAGHAVAAFFLRLSIGRRGVTIVPDNIKQNLGAAHILQQLRERPDVSISPRTHVEIEDYAVMCLAGDVADKKYYPARHFGGQRDQLHAIDLLTYISGSAEITSARMKVALLQAHTLVDLRWNEITAVAKALIDRKTLTRDEVREAICPPLRTPHG